MPVLQPPSGPIEISDPNNVPELFVNGPSNIMNLGALVQITFTAVRPNVSELFGGNTAPKFRGVVACRLVMPTEMAQQFARALVTSLIAKAEQGEPAGRA